MATLENYSIRKFLDEEVLVDPHGYVVTEAHRNLAVLHDALDLLVALWPKPGYQTVVIETHQWVKLRRLLLEVPRLVKVDE